MTHLLCHIPYPLIRELEGTSRNVKDSFKSGYEVSGT